MHPTQRKRAMPAWPMSAKMIAQMMIEMICQTITALRLAPNDTIIPEVIWLGCEFEGIMRPALRDGATRPFADSPRWSHRPSPFVLTRGGNEAVCLAAPHGGWLDYPL